MKHNIDNYDRRILTSLQRKGDIGAGELSTIIHLSPSQCSRRLERLRAAGFIDRIVAILDPKLLDISVTAYAMVTLRSHAPENAKSFHDRIDSLPEILEAHKIAGEADYLLKICTRDLQSYNELLTNHILAFSEVASLRSSIVLARQKSTTEMPLGFL